MHGFLHVSLFYNFKYIRFIGLFQMTDEITEEVTKQWRGIFKYKQNAL